MKNENEEMNNELRTAFCHLTFGVKRLSFLMFISHYSFSKIGVYGNKKT